MKMVYQ